MATQQRFFKNITLGFLTLSFLMVCSQAYAMEIIFDKTYNISRKASLTNLTWRSITFKKISEARVKYILTAEHPQGKSIEYLSGIDAAISGKIKDKMIPSFDLKTEKQNFDKNKQVTIEIELPYDFQTRYIPFKVVKEDGGFADYIIRMRFGDYRFLMANKVLNNVSNRPVENIANKDPNELYKKRQKLKRRVLEKKKKQVVTVDDLYSDMKPVNELEDSGIDSETAQTEKNEPSMYNEFENLVSKYGDEEVQIEDPEVAQTDTSSESNENIPETLPEKLVDTDTQKMSDDSFSADTNETNPTETLTSGDGSIDHQEESNADLTAKEKLGLDTIDENEDLSFNQAEEDKQTQDIASVPTQETVSVDDMLAVDPMAVDREPSQTEEKKSVKSQKPLGPWEFVYAKGFVFENKKSEAKSSPDSSTSEDKNKKSEEVDRLPSGELSGIDGVLSFEDEQANADKKKEE